MYKVAVILADDPDIAADRDEATQNVAEMLKMHNDLCAATGGHVQEEKFKCYTWQHK